MKKIVLCPNLSRDLGLEYTRKATVMLREAGHSVSICPLPLTDHEIDVPAGVHTEPLADSLVGADLLVSFGGDGTILQAARAAMHEKVPIIGVNLGTKGFMAELETGELQRLLDAANGKYELVRRMMIDVELKSGGKVIFSDTALNDAVVKGMMKVISLSAYSDGWKMYEFSGDGIIIATPTGSTAYSMSSGGPLVEPNAKNIIMTPVCAHVLAVKSFVLSPSRVVTVKVGDIAGKQAYLSVDGGKPVVMNSGDELIARNSIYETYMAHVGPKSFYDIAYEKLGDSK